MTAPTDVVVILAPNWLGDAVMALPAVADIRRHFSTSTLVVAARAGIAPLFSMVPGLDGVIATRWRGEWIQPGALRDDAGVLRESGARLAVLLPNSFASAWLATRADIAERWGYATDLRSRLLTRAVPRPTGSRHQADYYQHLTVSLGMPRGPLTPELVVADETRASARRLLGECGWDGRSRLVALAPGAAYGRAKQWLPVHVAQLVVQLASDGVTCVLVGSAADRATTARIASVARKLAGGGRNGKPAMESSAIIDLAGGTSLAELAAVLTLSSACVANDSGAMHVAAALGTPVVALFGPTIEGETRPLSASGGWTRILTAPVWCRPCMLRECPIDHRCMANISPDMVMAALDEVPSAPEMPRTTG